MTLPRLFCANVARKDAIQIGRWEGQEAWVLRESPTPLGQQAYLVDPSNAGGARPVGKRTFLLGLQSGGAFGALLV